MAKTSSERSMKWNRAHKDVVYARIAEIKKNNPQKYQAINKAYREKNADKLRANRKAYRDAHPEKEKQWRLNYANSEHGAAMIKQNSKAHYARLRQVVLAAYGGSVPHCACCGESHVEFLTIDHINGDGAKQRREGKRGINFYAWLVRNQFPHGFRVLCMNCNLSLGMRGYCPHRNPVV